MTQSINNEKYEKLISYLKTLGSAAVAFSGGVDSTFLLAAAREALNDKVIAITVDSPSFPRYELEDTIRFSLLLGVRHIILKEQNIDDSVRHNPADRCYFCKKIEFGVIREKARELGFGYVLDGSNADDLSDYRPGMKAIRETGVQSPLLEAGITKDEIRSYSKFLGLPSWNKPAYACLYSRIPYGQEIKPEDLEKIEKAERFLIDKGFKSVRVRCHGNLARIEVNPADCPKLFTGPLRSEIVSTLKSAGFKYITVDLIGYRMGSFNEQILPDDRSKLNI